MLSSAPVLRSPDFTRPFYIHCVASKTGVGGVQGKETTIAWNRAQRNYTALEQNCSAAH